MEPLRFPANRLSTRSRVFNIIRERSFARGEFTLVSGKKSNYYLDMKPTMFHPEGASILAQLILERLKSIDVDCVGGLEMGAVPLIAQIAMHSHDMQCPIPGFFVRKQIKDHGSKRRIEAIGEFKGKRAAILEDVTTSGGSAMEAVNAVRDAGGEVVLVLSIVDREEGAEQFFRDQGIPFEALFTTSEFMAAD